MGPLSRRRLLSLLALPACRLAGQIPSGMATRGIKPVARGKPSGLPFHARFTDIAAQAGLRAPVIAGHPKHADFVTEAMSCGVAFLDYDNDSWLDILILTGSRFGDPPAEASKRLYKNNRDGTFTDVTKPAGLLNEQPRFGSGCTFVDYDRDGHLDLFVSNYVAFNPDTVPRAGQSTSCSEKLFCGPRGLPYGRHSLYRNNRDGTFSDVTEKSGIAKTPGGYGLTAVAADFDNDGWPDLYVACDSTPSLFFRNNHDGTFTEQALDAGVALSEDGMVQAGMGLGIGDLRLDGNLHIVKTHFSGDTAAVYLNDGKGNFRDGTLRTGLAVETRFIEWGIGIADLDNDGNPDIFAVTGGIYPELQGEYKTQRIVFRNLGNGRFEELIGQAGPGVDAPHSSRGCAFGDFDNDGDIDIVIVNHNEPPSLLRNDVDPANHWLKIKLTGVQSNRSAIGARVTARYGGKIQAQELLGQSSYLSVNDSRLHFGLGAAEAVDIEIRWPLGRIEKLDKVPADRLIWVKEGSGIVRTDRFPARK